MSLALAPQLQACRLKCDMIRSGTRSKVSAVEGMRRTLQEELEEWLCKECEVGLERRLMAVHARECLQVQKWMVGRRRHPCEKPCKQAMRQFGRTIMSLMGGGKEEAKAFWLHRDIISCPSLQLEIGLYTRHN